ncbi:MAG TPA: 30S ribosomal protein S4 [Candidatus Hypogeohydataceae bacterium YC38]|nr:30S ribosomal protein S4 [Candidatus Brocadiales bacterium]
MARQVGPVCRLCRREGIKLYLKGSRCFTVKCPITRRKTVPGMHFWRSGKMSKFGVQFREKQKLKRFYGLLERQFRRIFGKAEMQKGNTGENMLLLLERRLDNVLYLTSFAASRKEARQIICHGHIMVNDRRVNIPSYMVKAGDVIRPATREKSQGIAKANLETYFSRYNSQWLELDKDAPQVKVSRLPLREEVSAPVQEQMVVELCTK